MTDDTKKHNWLIDHLMDLELFADKCVADSPGPQKEQLKDEDEDEQIQSHWMAPD